MKIIQTYWSLPARLNAFDAIENRNSGGFVNSKYHAMSWALSCLKFREFYSDLVLYTDVQGKRWLIDELKLPYTQVVCDLDVLNNYDSMLWALPKVYVYGQQDQPFLHVDGDVYVWDKIGIDAETKDIIVQNSEHDADYLKGILVQILDHFNVIPDYLRDVIDIVLTRDPNEDKVVSINAGILGGRDIEFMKYYAREAKKFVDDNLECLNKIDLGKFNVVFEQLLLTALAKKEGISITRLFEDADIPMDFLTPNYFLDTPRRNKYMHLVGPQKQKEIQCMILESKLQCEFPEVHDRIAGIYSDYDRKYRQYLCNNGIHNNPQPVEYKNTITFLKRTGYSISLHAACNELESCIDNMLETRDDNEARLIADIFEIEKITSTLSYEPITPNKELIADMVVHRNAADYRNWEDNLVFSLNSSNSGIVYLYHKFEFHITDESLEQLALGRLKVDPNGKRNILLATKVRLYGKNQVLYKYLTGWDCLLAYFDNEKKCTISELIDQLMRDNIRYIGENIESEVKECIMHYAFNKGYLCFKKANLIAQSI